MSGRLALVIGACSGIATAIARELAGQGYTLHLVARDATRLDAAAEDLRARGAAGVHSAAVDLLDSAAVDTMFDSLGQDGIRPDVVLIAQGVMYTNEQCAEDPVSHRRMIETNFSSVAHCALRSVPLFGPESGGELIAISSVAGDRGRPKNYCYGSTKAGLDAFLEGLRLSLAGSPINVMNLKPGPVDTPMSAHLPKGALWASPESVARIACAAIGRRRHRVYAPRYWRLVMWVIRALPGALLARLPV